MSDGVLAFPGRPGGCPPAVVAAVEALLFASGEPVRVRELARVLELPETEVDLALLALAARYQGDGVGIRLEEIARGWQLRTAPHLAPLILKLRGERPTRLSRAALEVLAVVAYRQPVTRFEIEQLRGVDCGAVLRNLLDRALVRVSGRRDEPGRPLEYRTTKTFLEVFSLADLSDLPTLGERAGLERPGEE